MASFMSCRDWPVVSLPSETTSLGLRTAPKMGQYSCPPFMESTPALPGLSRTEAVRKESLVPLGKDLAVTAVHLQLVPWQIIWGVGLFPYSDLLGWRLSGSGILNLIHL